MTLVPHLINLCSKRAIRASLHFNHLSQPAADRKLLARQLRAEVLRMKHAIATSNPENTSSRLAISTATVASSA